MPNPILSLVLLAGLGPQADDSQPRLLIDPLLLAEVVEVYRVIATDENPVWPGWNAADIPILLYIPDVQDALINHPAPPAGFARADCALLPDGWTLHLRDGETLLALDGQNTSRPIGGVETLVVADPVSNLRPQLEQLLRDPREAALKVQDLTTELLTVDPYTQLEFVVHEAFHVHQARLAEGKAASEALLLQYPWLSAENNAGFALEGRVLERALQSVDVEAAYEAALEWLAVRLDRRARLSPQNEAYEDGTEFSEGLARYTEWRLSEALEGSRPGEPMRWARGFRGYDDLSFWRARLLERVRSNLAGEMLVNNDPYGSGALRFRLYDSGMAIGVLLDRLELEGWHERIFEPGTTLTGLVQEALLASGEDLADALVRARARCDYDALLSSKQELERDGLAAAQAAAEAILDGSRLFTLDYSGLEGAAVAWGMTPFGITRVAASRTIYGLVPVSARAGTDFTLQQTAVSPALHDSERKTIQFQLIDSVDPASLPTGPVEDLDLELPGVKIAAKSGRLVITESGVTLVIP